MIDMKKIAAVWIAVILTVAVAACPARWTLTASSSSGDTVLAEYADQLAEYINQARADADMETLEVLADLNEMAAVRAEELAESFSNTRPDGTSFSTILSGISYTAYGENIADDLSAPEDVAELWLNAESQAENILGDFNSVGVGVYYDSDADSYYWDALFVSVSDSSAETTVAASDACTNVTDATLLEYADQVAYLVNQARTAEGLSELKVLPILHTLAATRAEELTKTFSHTRPDGTNCLTVLYGFIDYRAAGENIAAGPTSPEAVVGAWLNSTEHYENIMGDYNYIGIGVCYDDDTEYGYYWTQLFVYDAATHADAYLPTATTAATTTTASTTGVTTTTTTTTTTVTAAQTETTADTTTAAATTATENSAAADRILIGSAVIDFTPETVISLDGASQVLMVYALRSVGIEVPLSDEQEAAADVDGDGVITVQDAYLILLYYANVSAGNTVTWAELLANETTGE